MERRSTPPCELRSPQTPPFSPLPPAADERPRPRAAPTAPTLASATTSLPVGGSFDWCRRRCATCLAAGSPGLSTFCRRRWWPHRCAPSERRRPTLPLRPPSAIVVTVAPGSIATNHTLLFNSAVCLGRYATPHPLDPASASTATQPSGQRLTGHPHLPRRPP